MTLSSKATYSVATSAVYNFLFGTAAANSLCSSSSLSLPEANRSFEISFVSDLVASMNFFCALRASGTSFVGDFSSFSAPSPALFYAALRLYKSFST